MKHIFYSFLFDTGGEKTDESFRLCIFLRRLVFLSVRKSSRSLDLDSLGIGADPPQRFLPSAARCLVTALTLMAFDAATLQDTLSALAGGLSIS